MAVKYDCICKKCWRDWKNKDKPKKCRFCGSTEVAWEYDVTE